MKAAHQMCNAADGACRAYKARLHQDGCRHAVQAGQRHASWLRLASCGAHLICPRAVPLLCLAGLQAGRPDNDGVGGSQSWALMRHGQRNAAGQQWTLSGLQPATQPPPKAASQLGAVHRRTWAAVAWKRECRSLSRSCRSAALLFRHWTVISWPPGTPAEAGPVLHQGASWGGAVSGGRRRAARGELAHNLWRLARHAVSI